VTLHSILLKVAAERRVNLPLLSARTGYSVPHLSRLLRGQRDPTPECLLRVCRDGLRLSRDECARLLLLWAEERDARQRMPA
jgi:hypothetical protein